MTDFLEQCLAQGLDFTLQFTLLTREFLRLALLDQKLFTQFLKLIIGDRRWHWYWYCW
jgi:hypothetical protein